MRVLLTNDDGYNAPGLRALHTALDQQHSVVVVAPEHEQSGVGHAFTHTKSVRCRRLEESCGMMGYCVDGTPSDCVKLALATLLENNPDVVVSGINIGENTGMAGHYSGTVAAARESAFWQIPGIAFSVSEEAAGQIGCYASAAKAILSGIMDMHSDGFCNVRNSVFFNVNFPSCRPEEARGVKVTRQSRAFFDERYRIVNEQPGWAEYRLQGTRRGPEESEDYDSRALACGYITITPLSFDATAQEAMGRMAVLEGLRWYLTEK